MERLCVAPYEPAFQALLKVAPPGYEICSAAAPVGICRAGMDPAFLANRSESGVPLFNDLESALELADATLIPQTSNKFLTEYAEKARELSRLKGKRLLDCSFLNEEAHKEVAALLDGLAERERLVQDAVRPIGIPVVYVCSIFSGSDSFEVFELLASMLAEMGHAPVAVTSSELGVLYNNVVLPLEITTDYGKGIVDLNEKLRWIGVRTRADIMLVEVPQPISEYSGYIHYDFGVGAFALSKAIPPDGIVVCTASNLAAPDFISNVCASASLRLGSSWWAVHVGNQVVKTDNEPEDREFQRYYADEDDAMAIAGALRENGVPALCGFAAHELKRVLCQMIEEDLFGSSNEVIG